MPIPPAKAKLKIFDSLPPASADTMAQSVKGVSNQNEMVAAVLFSPNLRLLASLDNSRSQVSSSYQVSVTTGFTFSSTQSFSVAAEVGISVEVVSAKLTVTFALSFTEEFSSSKTTTMTFECPAGQTAFLYQGTLMSQILHFDASTAQYSWKGDTAQALTSILVTSSTSIGAAPLDAMTVSTV